MSAEVTIYFALAAPLLGALGIGLAGERFANLRETVTLTTAVVLTLLVWSLFPKLQFGQRPSVLVGEFLPGLPIDFIIEPFGLLFAALASLLWIVTSVYSIGYMRGNGEQKQTRFYVCFAISIFGAIGVAFAGNLLTLFLFYEILTLSTYPLVTHKGDERAIAAGRIYLGTLLATSIGLFLPAIVWTYHVADTLTFTPGGILLGRMEGPAVGLLLGLFVFGIGKAAVMPVHRWLPAAMVAPTPVSALLHAVAVVKAGVFTILKVVVYVFGVDFLNQVSSAEWLLFAAATTVVLASVIALRQSNLKRLLAYSTIAQLSYVVLAVAILRPLSEVGAMVHIIAHAFGKITLFFAAGSIYVASKKTEVHELAGIGRLMPWTMLAFTIGALSMIGLPPTAGFISKWFILSGALQAENYVAVTTIVLSTLLNGAYFLPIVYSAWFKEANAQTRTDHGEGPSTVVLSLGVTAGLTVLFFFANQTVLDLISP